MIVKFIEVYETTNVHANEELRSYSLREVFINPEQVVCIRSDGGFKQKLNEGQLPKDLDKRQEFTKIYLNRGQSGLDVTVVGAPKTIEERIRKTNKTILKG